MIPIAKPKAVLPVNEMPGFVIIVVAGKSDDDDAVVIVFVTMDKTP
jgi:hypothetical protein